MKKPDYQNPESLALRFMREKKKHTLLYVGQKTGIKPKVIDHMEKGRRVMTKEEIALFLGCYGYSLEVFNEIIKMKPLNKQAANHYFLRNNL